MIALVEAAPGATRALVLDGDTVVEAHIARADDPLPVGLIAPARLADRRQGVVVLAGAEAQLAPVPAIVVIVPSDAMRRMRWPVYSQNQRAPSGPRTTPNGLSSFAPRAGPPSPENPFSPVPATYSMVQPAAEIGRAHV